MYLTGELRGTRKGQRDETVLAEAAQTQAESSICCWAGPGLQEQGAGTLHCSTIPWALTVF